MYDYHLKFADEAEALSVLFDGETLKFRNIDVIGVIYKPTGNTLTTDEGDAPEMALVSGWHVNVRHDEEALDLVTFQIYPQHPVRRWA